jgi:hypothetical protein
MNLDVCTVDKEPPRNELWPELSQHFLEGGRGGTTDGNTDTQNSSGPVADRQFSSCNPLLVQKEYFQAQRTLTKEADQLYYLYCRSRVDFYGNYSFRYLRQKRLHFWSYSHHLFYLQREALSIKHDLQTRPNQKDLPASPDPCVDGYSDELGSLKIKNRVDNLAYLAHATDRDAGRQRIHGFQGRASAF